MPSTILIAGSGNVARDAGMYFLKQGNAVSWVSRSENCLVDLQAYVNGAVQAFMTRAREARGARSHGVRRMSAAFFLYNELEHEPYDVIIECTREALDDKKDVMARLRGRITGTTMLATTSLSIPPTAIHQACFAFRIRFPMELSKSAELVFPETMTPSEKELRRAFCRENGISCTG